MRGAWLIGGVVVTALLFGGPSVCFAGPKYDRNLERAVMEIVARKVGDIRGPLAKEWKPLEQDFAAPAPVIEFTTRGSILAIDAPAISGAAIRAAASIVMPTDEPVVRLIPLHN